jgi:hypothetical protein
VAAGCGAKLESQTSSATSAEPATRSSWEQDIPIPFECAGAAIIFDKVNQHIRFIERATGVSAFPSSSSSLSTILLRASNKVSRSSFEEAVRMTEDLLEHVRDDGIESEDGEDDESESGTDEITHEASPRTTPARRTPTAATTPTHTTKKVRFILEAVPDPPEDESARPPRGRDRSR